MSKRNTIISRTIVSRRVRELKESLYEDINKSTNQLKVLFIEMDEVHANLQDEFWYFVLNTY